MKYKIRDGIILTSVCGQHLLVAASAAREFCPYVTQINETSAFIWRQLEQDRDIPEIREAVLKEWEVEDSSSLDDMINSLCSELENMGYLEIISKGQENENK